MKKNLGQHLLEQKLISEKELAAALQRQVIFGGRLGTNLLEMGSLSEENLLGVLSAQHGIPCVKPSHFQDLPKNVIDCIPMELVAKHGVVPIALEGNRITLAMRDPDRLDMIDEVSFKTGKTIKPVIASELRIVQALEHYYGIKREARYVYVPSSREVMTESPNRPSAEASKHRQEKVPQEDEVIDLTSEDFVATDPFDPTFVNEGFLNIHNRDEVALTVIRAGLQFLDDVFMFIVKGDEATGWMAGGSAKPVVDFGGLSLTVAPSSALGKVREKRTLERFQGIEIFEGDPWLKELSLLVPKEVILCPLVLKSHVVSILLGLNFRDPLEEIEAEYLVRIMRKASVAFEILILKSRIIML